MRRRACSASPIRQHGITLLVLLAVLGLAAVFVLVGKLGSSRLQNERDPVTEAALMQAKEALIGFAATYAQRHANQSVGFLPCPDTDGDGDGDALDNCGIAGNAVVGMLPYRTLELPPLHDSHGECLWYAVSGKFKNNPKLAPLNWDTQGGIRIVDAFGTSIADDGDVDDGVAAVVIAPGPPLSGQNRTGSASVCGRTPVSAAFLEAGNDFVPAPNVTLTQGIVGSAVNNDLLASVSPRQVFQRAKENKSAFDADLDGLIGAAASLLASDFPLPTVVNFPASPVLDVGGLPPYSPATFGSSPTLDAKIQNYWLHWGNQFGYARCSDGSQCITVAGSACRGVLVFVGERTAGQRRLTPDQQNNEANYLDTGNLGQFASPTPAFVGSPSYSTSAAGQDVVICLN